MMHDAVLLQAAAPLITYAAARVTYDAALMLGAAKGVTFCDTRVNYDAAPLSL